MRPLSVYLSIHLSLYILLYMLFDFFLYCLSLFFPLLYLFYSSFLFFISSFLHLCIYLFIFSSLLVFSIFTIYLPVCLSVYLSCIHIYITLHCVTIHCITLHYICIYTHTDLLEYSGSLRVIFQSSWLKCDQFTGVFRPCPGQSRSSVAGPVRYMRVPTC